MRFPRTLLFLVLLCVALSPSDSPGAEAAPVAARPPMRDFIGLNVHTVKFKPALYQPVCRLLRDYHGLDWDIGNRTDTPTEFPMAHNKVNWESLYGKWVEAGYEIDASIMLGRTAPDKWTDPEEDAFRYGEAFASFFGPGGRSLVTSAEIGNEPGSYSDAQYRAVFEAMARGFRKGDPKLQVATCALTAGKSGKYAKSVQCVAGLESLYDVLNVHSYAQVEGWPTWRRSYPEDPSIDYLKDIEAVIEWRDHHAPGKAVWLTEFGWDASTKPAPAKGTFAKWIGSSEVEQARYLVRSLLIFSSMPLDRAYIYWFNDNDTPHVHGSSGLTRNYVPKPAFHAVSYLYATLGDYRFERVLSKEKGGLWCFEYTHTEDPRRRIQVLWMAVGGEETREIELKSPGNGKLRIEKMPLAEGKPESWAGDRTPEGNLRVTVGPTPIFVELGP